MCRRRVVLRVVGVRKQRRTEFSRAALHSCCVTLSRERLCRTEDSARAVRNCNGVLNARRIHIDVARRELERLAQIRLIVKNNPDVLVRHLIVQIERIRDGTGNHKALVPVGR